VKTYKYEVRTISISYDNGIELPYRIIHVLDDLDPGHGCLVISALVETEVSE
jgi:hypothetical protein